MSYKQALLFILLFPYFVLSATTNAEKEIPPQKEETPPAEEKTLPLEGTFLSKEGHFSVTLPSGFTRADHDIQPTQTELGEIESISYTAFADTSFVTFGTSEYPEAILVFNKGKEKWVLDTAEEGTLKNFHATIVSSKDTTTQKFPSRLIEFTTAADGNSLYGKALFILTDSRLYYLLFITSSPVELASPEVSKFFDSFKITE